MGNTMPRHRHQPTPFPTPPFLSHSIRSDGQLASKDFSQLFPHIWHCTLRGFSLENLGVAGKAVKHKCVPSVKVKENCLRWFVKLIRYWMSIYMDWF